MTSVFHQTITFGLYARMDLYETTLYFFYQMAFLLIKEVQRTTYSTQPTNMCNRNVKYMYIVYQLSLCSSCLVLIYCDSINEDFKLSSMHVHQGTIISSVHVTSTILFIL